MLQRNVRNVGVLALLGSSIAWLACDSDPGAPDADPPNDTQGTPDDGSRDDGSRDDSRADASHAGDAQGTSSDDAHAGDAQGGTSSSPSGVDAPVGDLPGWRQVFVDDFTTDVPLGKFPEAVSSKWSAYSEGWKDTSKNGTYSPGRVVSIHDGVLDKYLRTENGARLVAAILPKIPGADGKGGLSAGRFAVRFKADSIPRYKVAWLLWPVSEQWPKDGEIDFPEGDLDGTISGFMHRQAGTSGGDQDAFSTSTTFSSWHTAVIEWTPQRCAFFLDDAKIGESTQRVPNTPMRWVIQTETWLGSAAPLPETSGHVYVDWVAAYVPDGS